MRGRAVDAAGRRVLAYLASAEERDVVAFAAEEARVRGLPLTIAHRGPLGQTCPVGDDVSVTRLLVPDKARAEQLLSSRRNELVVVSSRDLHAERSVYGAAGLRRTYAGAPHLVAVVPDGYEPSPSR